MSGYAVQLRKKWKERSNMTNKQNIKECECGEDTICHTCGITTQAPQKKDTSWESKATEIVFKDQIYRLENMTFEDWKKNIRQQTIPSVIEEIEGMVKKYDVEMKDGLSPNAIDGYNQALEDLKTLLKQNGNKVL